MALKDKNIGKVRLLNLIHFTLTVLSFFFVWSSTIELGPNEYRYHFYVTALYAVLLYLFDTTYNAYLVGFMTPGDLAYSQTLSNVIAFAGVYALTALAWTRLYNIVPFLLLIAGQLVFNILWDKFADAVYFKLYKPKRTAVIYRNRDDLMRIREIEDNPKKFTIERYIESPKENIFELMDQLSGYEVLFVVGIGATFRNALAKYCVENNVQGYFLPHVGDILMAGAEHVQSYSVPILSVKRKAPDVTYLMIKRAADIVLSLLALIIMSPFMLLTALCIRLYDGGPALYKQIRLTKDGREFKILKFRSMRTDAEKDGVARLSSEHDDRITPVGRVIRAIRFDELPQLFNILVGDMSIVGPRPERPEIAHEYEKYLPAFALRLQVKAGLTGYAQVYGKYNTDPRDKLEMDLLYINKMSLFTDVMLMFATIRILFIRESTSGIEEGKLTAYLSEKLEREEKEL
ncbi:MAG: exopolysaccharide biosynthesis polyprenyl glycosylphosphotransferase [Lachnospiraceae bacterium]|nr:exopolysaccharide biosynthesis polyprenyl glycosylphosphotransferase [Lachnospiraceae bacterium]